MSDTLLAIILSILASFFDITTHTYYFPAVVAQHERHAPTPLAASPDTRTPQPVTPGGNARVWAAGGTLAPEDVPHVLRAAGWPEHLHHEATLQIECESTYRAYVTNGVMLGLFQISDRQGGWQGWWEYYGFDPARYAEPVYNAQLAWKIYNYDIERGYAPWTQWQCKPWR